MELEFAEVLATRFPKIHIDMVSEVARVALKVSDAPAARCTWLDADLPLDDMTMRFVQQLGGATCLMRSPLFSTALLV